MLQHATTAARKRFSWKAFVMTAVGLSITQWLLYAFVINRDGGTKELPKLEEVMKMNPQDGGSGLPAQIPYPWHHAQDRPDEKVNPMTPTLDSDLSIVTAPPESLQPIPTNPQTSDPNDEYLAFCISIKDQREDLPEFLVHHYHHHTIRRFYIQDDGSTPPLSSNASEYGIPAEALTFRYYNDTEHVQYMQLKVYDDCMKQHGHKHKWMAFLDTDEFYEATGKESIREILQSFDGNGTVGALAVNWRMHTSAGLLTRPESNRKAFTSCVWDESHPENKTIDSDNRHIKSIVKTDKYAGPGSPHNVRLVNGSVTVGELGDEVTEWAMRRRITRERIVLHHYSLKSREQWAEKLDRGNGMGDPKSWEFWDRVEAEPHVECQELASYYP